MSNGLEVRLWWGDHLVAEHFFRPGVSPRVVGLNQHVDWSINVDSPSEAKVAFRRGDRAAKALRDLVTLDEASDQWLLSLCAGEYVSFDVGSLRAELQNRRAPKAVKVPLAETADFQFANIVMAAFAVAAFFVLTAINSEPSGTPWADVLSHAATTMAPVHVSVTPPQPERVASPQPERASPTQAATTPVARKTFSKPKPLNAREVVRELSGGALSALFGSTGLPTDLQHALSQVTGPSHVGALATTQLRGVGRGSGPYSPGELVGLEGLKTKGRSTGSQYGAEVGTPLKPMTREIRISTTEPVVIGALPPELIREVIHRNRSQLRYCYEVALPRDPTLAGKITAHFVIGEDGSVRLSEVAQTTMHDPQTEACVTSRIRTWQFPRPLGGGVVSVTYPFVFKSAP